jgi:hypothetical protein
MGLRAAGLLLLLAGIFYPWVVFDSLAARAERLERLEELVSGAELPAPARELLVERGYRPGLAPDQLWHLLGRDEFAPNFDFAGGRVRLFSWDFLRVPTSRMVKAAVIGVYLVAGLGVVLLALGARREARKGEIPIDDPTAAGRERPYLVAGVCLAAALIVISAGPLLDTFGFFGRWGIAWLDVLSGARVTVAPRALVPLGLLLLATAELADRQT